MQGRKLRIGWCRFAYGGNGGVQSEHPAVGSWLSRLVPKVQQDPRCEAAIWEKVIADTPITMTRNRAIRLAKRDGVDILLMIDSDMSPDLYHKALPDARPFWDTSFDFLYRRWDAGPRIILAPYCGPPPGELQSGEEMVYVFHWDYDQTDEQRRRVSLKAYSRHEAGQRSGMEEVAAGPTGLIMLDLRLTDNPDVRLPWFDYEWEDPPYNTKKATTEDVYFTRNCSLAGIPVFCNWDAWAGHVKPVVVGKPAVATVEEVGQHLQEIAIRAIHRGESVREVNPGETPESIAAGLGLQSPEVVKDEPPREPATEPMADGHAPVCRLHGGAAADANAVRRPKRRPRVSVPGVRQEGL